MTNRPVTHARFTLERRYPVPPDTVFTAWADPGAKARWFSRPGDEHQLDFRVGGCERVRAVREDGSTLTFEARYQDVVENERIVYSGTLHQDQALCTISITTVCFHPTAEGTRIVLTEQGTFLDGREEPAWRERGTTTQLAALETELRQRSPRP